MTPEPVVQTKTYYSTAAGLIVNINVGRRIIEEGGTTKMVDQKIAEFSPLGDKYGRLVTSDPEVIKAMDSRMATLGDVFDGNEYTRRTTPAEVRNKMLEGENARLAAENKRIVEDHNRLLTSLGEQGKLPKAAAPSK